jgi:predicted dinucleotide-binding enzyme
MGIMKIGIIGSGDVGRTLADGLLDLGHQVKIGTRDTSKKEIVEWIDKHR